MDKIINKVAMRVLGLFLLLVMGQSAYADKLTIENFSIAKGQTVEVPVYLEVTNENGLGSIQFEVTLPNNLAIEDAIMNTDFVGKKYYSDVDVRESDNSYQVLVLGEVSKSVPAITGEGVLCNLVITASDAYDGLGGLVSIANAKSGDFVTYETVNFETSNLYVVANVDLSADAVTIEKADGETLTEVAVNMDGNVEVYGLQAIITLPEGLSIEEDSEEDDPTPLVSKTSRTSKFQVDSRYVDGQKNAVKVLISSMTGKAFTGTSGAIFTFNVVGDSTLAAKSQIEISKVFASQKDGVANMALNGITIDVIGVEADAIATGIESVQSGLSSAAVEAYTLSGQKVNKVTKGQLYIVKGANGKATKVLVK